MIRVFLLIALFILPFLSISQSDRESAKSVVKVKAYYKGKDNNNQPKLVLNTSTGWVWNSPQWIVTTLHSVAGVDKIEVCSVTDNCSNARIVKVLREADLAIIKTDKNLGLRPLKSVYADPQSSKTYHIWGFPHSVHTIQGDEIKFSKTLGSFPKLIDILKRQKLKDQLERQKYPSTNANIFRISSIIQPGHSGAPIMTSNGDVIGIADGGLRGGAARINWAMPSDKYLKKLVVSTEVPPSTVSIQTNLYSDVYYLPLDVNESQVDSYIVKKEEEGTINSNTGSEVHKTWTATYDDLYTTLDEEDQATLDIMLDDLDDDEYEDIIGKAMFDVYEDFNTGATFVVPSNAQMTFEEESFHAKLTYSDFGFISFNTPSYEEAKEELNAFIKEMAYSFEESIESEDFDGDFETDDSNEYTYRVDAREVTMDGEDFLFLAGGVVKKSDLACFFLICPLISEMDYEQSVEFARMGISTQMISFSGH